VSAGEAGTARSLEGFASALEALGREVRERMGAEDVRCFVRLKWVSRAAEWAGRLALIFGRGPLSFCVGVASLTLHLALEAQLNHTVTHGAYAGLEGAEAMAPLTYETLALPLQSATWRMAHKIHHAHPSVLGRDPDTIHPLFRVHPEVRWRPWHALNTVLGGLLVFECWGLDYDAFLKRLGLRDRADRGELYKLGRFVAYQYVLFALVAWGAWPRVLVGTLFAVIVRNYVFVILQTGSSVGEGISTWHAAPPPRSRGRDEQYRFQVETSKDYPLPELGTLLCGGLDRHIEHHLFPDLPPQRLRALSGRVRALCEAHGVRYVEHPSAWASYADSFRYLLRLSWPEGRGRST
jgi:linoleoyl-CoA desaturase